MANEIKKYVGLSTLQNFKNNLDNTFATQSRVNTLSDNVAYIDITDNEDIEDTTSTVSAVLYTPQNLTNEQQARARTNIGLGNVDNVKQYSASNPPPYPVTQVNGKTGDITLSASDVGALSSTTHIPVVLQSTGTSTEDTMSQKAITDELNRVSSWVTPQMFGAKGDGKTDDTAAINNALTDAGSSGRQVYFPAGTYKVTSSLKVPNDILLRGDCGKSVIKTFVTSGYVLEAPSSTTLASNSIVDLTFQNGNPQDSTTKLQSGDFINVAQGLYMQNCRVKNYYRVFSFFSHNSYLYNNRFTAIYKHFTSSSTDSVVYGNYINSSRYGLAQKSKMYITGFNSTSFQNNLVDYFYDVFALSSAESGTISNNTFNRCVTVFHDGVLHLSVCNNTFTGMTPSAVDMSVLTAAQQAELTAEKWGIIKFDNKAISKTNHIMAVVSFANNIGYNVDNYIYIADGVQVVVAETEFRGNMINTGSANKPSAVDVGFRNAAATETAYNSFQNVYFDFLDMKEWTSLPSASLTGNTAKSVKSFPYMKAIYNNEIYININGAWRMYAPPIYDGGIT